MGMRDGRTKLRRDAGRLHPTYAGGASDRPENPVFPGIKPVRTAKKEERAKRKLSRRGVTSGKSNRAICTAPRAPASSAGEKETERLLLSGRTIESFLYNGDGEGGKEEKKRWKDLDALKPARRTSAEIRGA